MDKITILEFLGSWDEVNCETFHIPAPSGPWMEKHELMAVEKILGNKIFFYFIYLGFRSF